MAKFVEIHKTQPKQMQILNVILLRRAIFRGKWSHQPWRKLLQCQQLIAVVSRRFSMPSVSLLLVRFVVVIYVWLALSWLLLFLSSWSRQFNSLFHLAFVLIFYFFILDSLLFFYFFRRTEYSHSKLWKKPNYNILFCHITNWNVEFGQLP